VGAGELIFTATYNEAGNIEQWVRDCVQTRPEASLLVVDDSSPDGTGDLLHALAQELPQLTVMERPGKLGLSTAHRLAMKYALRGGYDVLVTMDADSSHQPAQIPQVVAALTDADFVIGTRYRGGSHQASRFRQILSFGANRLAMMLLATGLSEYTTSFRAFSPAAMAAVDEADFDEGGYAFFMECIDELSRRGFRLTEVPIDFLDRHHGVSKIPKWQVAVSAQTLARLAWERRITHKRRSAIPHTHANNEKCNSCGGPWLVRSEGDDAGVRLVCLACGGVQPEWRD
jgi:glycosyltransferase involved in cell wall biosynthesis